MRKKIIISLIIILIFIILSFIEWKLELDMSSISFAIISETIVEALISSFIVYKVYSNKDKVLA